MTEISFFPVPMSGTCEPLGPVMVLAVIGSGFVNVPPSLLLLRDDGSLAMSEFENLKLDLRYDYRDGKWIDVSEVDDGGTEEEGDDGGEEVSGDLSDLD